MKPILSFGPLLILVASCNPAERKSKTASAPPATEIAKAPEKPKPEVKLDAQDFKKLGEELTNIDLVLANWLGHQKSSEIHLERIDDAKLVFPPIYIKTPCRDILDAQKSNIVKVSQLHPKPGGEAKEAINEWMRYQVDAANSLRGWAGKPALKNDGSHDFVTILDLQQTEMEELQRVRIAKEKIWSAHAAEKEK